MRRQHDRTITCKVECPLDLFKVVKVVGTVTVVWSWSGVQQISGNYFLKHDIQKQIIQVAVRLRCNYRAREASEILIGVNN